MTQVEQELRWRQQLWEHLRTTPDGPKNVPPSTLHALNIYKGAHGIWVDKSRTAAITPDGYGIAVSLVHSGKSYPDDWSEHGVIYHYPQTKRPGRDLSEIEATKNASRYSLPVFVITHTSHSMRDVYLGWVEAWDDQAKQFLVVFDEQFPNTPVPRKQEAAEVGENDEPFVLFSPRKGTQRMVTGRPDQQRFKFQLVKRYGLICAVCGLRTAPLLQAAHIVPKEHHGSDDPRNGLVLCANHHLAFDLALFSIHPESLAIGYQEGYDQEQLQIAYENLCHLPALPHPEALLWRYHHQGLHISTSKRKPSKQVLAG